MVDALWQARISSVIDLLQRLKNDESPEDQEWAIDYWNLVLQRLKNEGRKVNA
jgi:hypothetical protein